MLKRILSHSAIYGLAPQIPKIAGIFTLPIITKYLTETDYGIAGTISAYSAAIAVFSTLGVPIVLSVSFYKNRCQYKWLWKQIYGFLQVWMLFFAIFQGTLLYFIIPEAAQNNKWWIILLSNFSTVFFGATSLIGTLHYQLLQKPIPIAIRSVISGLLTVFANLVFVAYLQMGYMGWYLSSFIAGCFINISYWKVVNITWRLNPIYKFKWRTIKKSLKTSIPTVPHYYSSFLLESSSRLVMDKTGVSIGVIGNYNLASQFGGYFNMFVNALNTAINPMAMQQIRNQKEDVARGYIFYMVIIVFSATFMFSLWAKEIFQILIKNEVLQSTYPLAIILVMAYNYRPMYIASSNMFFYYEKTNGLLKITLLAGIMAFAGYLLVIPVWGVYGAAIIYYVFLQYMGYSGFFMLEFRKKTKVQYPFKQIFLVSLGTFIMVYFLVELMCLYKMVITCIWIALACYLLNKNRLSIKSIIEIKN